jgi:hypothetical protein
MIESENSFEIVPINKTCSSNINTTVIKASPGSSGDALDSGLNNIDAQNKVNAQYDSVDNIEVKSLTGGSLKNYIINFRTKKYNINSDNEINAIKTILNNKIYKKDYLLYINEKNNNKIVKYVIIRNKKNKFIKSM